MSILPAHSEPSCADTAKESCALPDPHGALAVACSLGAGDWRVAIKDSLDVAGLPTRQGSAVLADAAPAAAHAEVVAHLLADGRWRIVGKANMHEFAFGVTGVNPRCGTPVNPRWPARIPGGSSSGSAVAVAGGLVDMAIGTDTGGSVRMPAACCGVTGFKPTYGLVSRRGAWPMESSLDCVGVFARDVALVEAAMTAIVPGFAVADEPRAPVLGVLDPTVADDVGDAVAAAIARWGGACRSRALPGLDTAFDAGMVIIGRESWQALAQFADDPAMGEDVRARILAGRDHAPERLAAAEAVRQVFSHEVDAALAGVDALVLPTLPSVPPTLAEATDPRAVLPLTRLVRPFNLSGHPAITLPVLTAQGLPAGVQLVGRKGGDAALLALARCLWRGLDTFHAGD